VILDTNGLSALVEGESSLEPVLRKEEHLAIPAIVLGEYRYGIWHSRNRLHYQQWLQQYLPQFRILDIEDGTTNGLSAD
jgi:tRNA(fMet)-specific endonuclease VapC